MWISYYRTETLRFTNDEFDATTMTATRCSVYNISRRQYYTRTVVIVIVTIQYRAVVDGGETSKKEEEKKIPIRLPPTLDRADYIIIRSRVYNAAIVVIIVSVVIV